MKILVVSDTHRGLFALKRIIDENKNKCDMVIHLGDGEREFETVRAMYPELGMVYVAGNCDYGSYEDSHIVMTPCGVKIFCCHGHRYGVRQGLELLAETAKNNGCSVALYGHTHLFRSEFVSGVLVMNPGSPTEPRGGNKPTYGILTIEGDGVLKPEIIELT